MAGEIGRQGGNQLLDSLTTTNIQVVVAEPQGSGHPAMPMASVLQKRRGDFKAVAQSVGKEKNNSTVSVENGSVSSTSTCQLGATNPTSSAESQQVVGLQACENCGTTQAPQWRRKYRGRPDTKPTLCNACAIYFQRNHRDRPLNLFGKPGEAAPDAAAVVLPQQAGAPAPPAASPPVKRERAAPRVNKLAQQTVQKEPEPVEDGSNDSVRRSGRQRRAKQFGPEWDAIQADPALAGGGLKRTTSQAEELMLPVNQQATAPGGGTVPKRSKAERQQQLSAAARRHPTTAAGSGPKHSKAGATQRQQQLLVAKLGGMELDEDSTDGGAELLGADRGAAPIHLSSQDGGSASDVDLDAPCGGRPPVVETRERCGLDQLYETAELMAAEELLNLNKDRDGWRAYQQAAALSQDVAWAAPARKTEPSGRHHGASSPASVAGSLAATIKKAASVAMAIKRQRLSEDAELPSLAGTTQMQTEHSDAVATAALALDYEPAVSGDDGDLEPPRDVRLRAVKSGGFGVSWRCHECRAESTAQRRRDPRNGNALCNACWARWDKAHMFDAARRGKRSATHAAVPSILARGASAGEATLGLDLDACIGAAPGPSPTGRPPRRAAPLPGHWAASSRPPLRRAASDADIYLAAQAPQLPPTSHQRPRTPPPPSLVATHCSSPAVSLSLACDEVLESASVTEQHCAALPAGAGEVQSGMRRSSSLDPPVGRGTASRASAAKRLLCPESPLPSAAVLSQRPGTAPGGVPAVCQGMASLAIAPLVITLSPPEAAADLNVTQPHATYVLASGVQPAGMASQPAAGSPIKCTGQVRLTVLCQDRPATSPTKAGSLSQHPASRAAAGNAGCRTMQPALPRPLLSSTSAPASLFQAIAPLVPVSPGIAYDQGTSSIGEQSVSSGIGAVAGCGVPAPSNGAALLSAGLPCTAQDMADAPVDVPCSAPAADSAAPRSAPADSSDAASARQPALPSWQGTKPLQAAPVLGLPDSRADADPAARASMQPINAPQSTSTAVGGRPVPHMPLQFRGPTTAAPGSTPLQLSVPVPPAAALGSTHSAWPCQTAELTSKFSAAFLACVQEMQARGLPHAGKKPFFLHN